MSIPFRWSDAHDPPINPPDSATAALPDAQARLAALSGQVRAELHCLRHPEIEWMPQLPERRDTGEGVDVAIAGAGQGGLAVAGLLLREQVGNILVFDKAARNEEGIWRDFARMPIIRSPKHYPGPDMGHGFAHLRSLASSKIRRQRLAALEPWYQLIAGKIICAGCARRSRSMCKARRACRTSNPHARGLRLTLRTPKGEPLGASRVGWSSRLDTMALGVGGCRTILQALPAIASRARRWIPIDFAALRDKTSGGARRRCLGRRQRDLCFGSGCQLACKCFVDATPIDAAKSIAGASALALCAISADLSDEWRWRFMHYILNVRMGMPPDTWQRLASFDNFELVTGCEWRAARHDRTRQFISTQAEASSKRISSSPAPVTIKTCRRDRNSAR